MRDSRLRVVVTVLVTAAWLALLTVDDGWSALSFIVYFLAFTIVRSRPLIGVAYAAGVSALWTAVSATGDAPTWTLAIPTGVFLAGCSLAYVMYTFRRLNDEQASLIHQLRSTREELARSERTQGALEERARVAGEIHDTLAQGFTSIVLMSRALRRSGATDPRLDTIEDVAQQNLDTARRLVRADRPAELEDAALPDALRRHAGQTSVGDHVVVRVVGDPRPLPGSHEVMILRAMQQSLANVETHAEASTVEVTLTYLPDSVALDVRDDGVGFHPGTVADRGQLTGGQGLQLLGTRVSALGGTLAVETAPGEGTVISVHLPESTA